MEANDQPHPRAAGWIHAGRTRPHVKAIAPVTGARITLTHVLEHPDNRNGSPPVDPLAGTCRSSESQRYLEEKIEMLSKDGLERLL